MPRADTRFVFEQSVNKSDECFEQAIFDLPRPGDCPAFFNRYEPLFVCAPRVQGRTSFLHHIRDLWLEVDWRSARPCLIEVEAQGAPSRERMAEVLSLAMRVDRTEDSCADCGLEAILRSSEAVATNRRDDAITLILIDSVTRGNASGVHWLLYSLYLLFREAIEWLREARVQIIMSGDSRALSMIDVVGSDFPLPALTIRNFRSDELARVCRRACARTATSFAHGAVVRLFQETGGDKYFTNFVAARSVVRALEQGRDEVLAEDIASTADGLRQGTVEDPRVMRPFRQSGGVSGEIEECVRWLLSGNALAWDEIDTARQERLFDLGLVGPLHTSGTTMSLSLRQRTSYGIRNPMVAERLYQLTSFYSSEKGIYSSELDLRQEEMEEEAAAGRMERDQAWFEHHRLVLLNRLGRQYVAVRDCQLYAHARTERRLLRRLRRDGVSAYVAYLADQPQDDVLILGGVR